MHDNRQTGSNVARIIIVDNEIQALNLALSTLTKHIRLILRELIEQGYYVKTDYRWCVLDKESNTYVLMTDAQVEELRQMFNFQIGDEIVEEVLVELKEGNITKEEAYTRIGDDKNARFIQGLNNYYDKYSMRPIKVPVYERVAF